MLKRKPQCAGCRKRFPGPLTEFRGKMYCLSCWTKRLSALSQQEMRQSR